jgi:hypothetical protein
MSLSLPVFYPLLRASQAVSGPFSFPFCSLSLARERAGVRVVHRTRTPPHPCPLPLEGARDTCGTRELNDPERSSPWYACDTIVDTPPYPLYYLGDIHWHHLFL